MDPDKTTPVELTDETMELLQKLARATNLSNAAIIRLAVEAGLPALASQLGKKTDADTKNPGPGDGAGASL